MNSNKQNTGRRAIAMIELIFAIVIIGITLMSVPNLIDRAAKSGYTSLQQEAIAVASSQIGLILAMKWDDNDNHNPCESPLIVSNGDPKLTTRPNAPFRNFADCYTASLTPASATVIGWSEGGIFDDIDDADILSDMRLDNIETTDTETGDVVDIDVSMLTTVTYLTDSPTANDYRDNSSITFNFDPTDALPGSPPATSNIKAVTTTLTTKNPATELEKTIIFHTFACNIGPYEASGVPK